MPYGQILTDSITDSSGGVLAPSSSVFRNRIINGAMVIDQRNAGASVTVASATYGADRWEAAEGLTTGVLTAQQVSDAPTGFSNSLKFTVTTAGTALAAENTYVRQFIEGYNSADLAWGSASAATITISFWAKSSLTGTFSGGLFNAGADRSYVFTYTINSANTWEQKTVTITGDTSGTWNTSNGRGIGVVFDLGSGSNQTGSASSWTASLKWKATGSVSLIGTLNATLQITGVQLEKGSTATSFDYLDYGRSLAQCQRYYERQVWSTGAAAALLLNTGYTNGVANVFQTFKFAVEKRAAATTTKLGTWSVSNAGQPLVYGSDTFGCSLYFVSTGAASSPYALAAGSGQGFDATAEL